MNRKEKIESLKAVMNGETGKVVTPLWYCFEKEGDQFVSRRLDVELRFNRTQLNEFSSKPWNRAIIIENIEDENKV